MLAAFLVQPQPPAGALRPEILHLHGPVTAKLCVLAI
jgi:hypothetical protein